jgi:hypothetical protein
MIININDNLFNALTTTQNGGSIDFRRYRVLLCWKLRVWIGFVSSMYDRWLYGVHFESLYTL